MAYLQYVAMAVAFLGAAHKGMEEKKAKIKEAEALRAAKNRGMAATTREMAEEQRVKIEMHSRGVAVAAFSGAGVDTPTVVNALGDLNAEGTYRIMAKLWQGSNDAEGLIFRSEAARREGDSAFTAGIVKGVVSAISVYTGMGGGFGEMGKTGHELARSTYGGTGAMATSAQGLPFSPIANPPPTKLWGN